MAADELSQPDFRMGKQSLSVILLLISSGPGAAQSISTGAVLHLNDAAEQYVRLALFMGVHDSDYVDAYIGPPEWREDARAEPLSPKSIAMRSGELAQQVRELHVDNSDHLSRLRQDYIASHLASLSALARMREGERLSFDEESKAIYGFVADQYPRDHYDKAISVLENILPGEEPLHERINSFWNKFRIPDNKIESIVLVGIEECRKRTNRYFSLPEGNTFQLELVSDQPWSAYNWYMGDGQSLIQVNVGPPKYLGASINIGCHEGYPGHHTSNTIIDYEFVKERGWIEFTIFPLYSPSAVILEGTATFASDLVFPGTSRAEFLRRTILPVVDFPVSEIEDLQIMDDLQKVRKQLRSLRYAGIEAARNFLDGRWSKEETTTFLIEFALLPPEHVDDWFAFTERYRAYVITYDVGRDLVQAYVEDQNPDGDQKGNWLAFKRLLYLPPTPMLFVDR